MGAWTGLSQRLNALRREIFGWRIPGATPPTVRFPKRPTFDRVGDCKSEEK
jgi:hypothetical protein